MGVHGNCILISSRAKFARRLYLKLISIELIKSSCFDFALSNCPSDIINLFLSVNVLLYDVHTILVHHFMLFFRILSQKEKFYIKRKYSTQSNCLTFVYLFYVGWTYILTGSLYIKVVSQ